MPGREQSWPGGDESHRQCWLLLWPGLPQHWRDCWHQHHDDPGHHDHPRHHRCAGAEGQTRGPEERQAEGELQPRDEFHHSGGGS